MDMKKEEKVRVRAYEIWERTGHSGSPEDHWFQAEMELELEVPALPEQDKEGQSGGEMKKDASKE